MQHNPLLNLDGLPPFEQIEARHIEPAVSRIINENRRELDNILAANEQLEVPRWETLMAPLDDLEDRLEKVWSTASHLNGVNNTPEIRAAYDKCQPLVTEYHTDLAQNERLFVCMQKLQKNGAVDASDERELASRNKIIDDYLLDFKLAGVDLPPEQKKEFSTIQQKLSNLSNRFSNNVLDATMAWSKHITDKEELAGLPELVLDSAAETARARDLDGYVLTLDLPVWMAVMTNAENEQLREEAYTAFVTRASDVGPHAGQWDNRDLIEEILDCRARLAALLGYNNYAEVSLAKKMAESVDRVNEFLDDLIECTRPAARQEFAELQAFAREHYGKDKLQAWDIAWYSEKLRKQNYDVSQDELRPWFPVDTVREGLFAITNILYGVTIRENPRTEVWHPDVKAYDIFGPDNELVASFFLDLFTREGKRGGAWMADYRSRRKLFSGDASGTGSVQTPVAWLACNFAPGSPALLTHNDVTTFFHEFGHGLHHMLTRETTLGSSGINGVAWDAVEMPSQLMENWCWNPEAIAMMSSHYQTGDPLPEVMLNKLLAARNFQAGMKMMRQLEFALFDFRLHQSWTLDNRPDVAETLNSVRATTSVIEVPDFNRFQNSFAHIFAGGYAAGYYSYKWAEVLSADVFQKFGESAREAESVLNPETGRRFLDEVLSRGGGQDALTLFINFMGREPDTGALLRQEGLR